MENISRTTSYWLRCREYLVYSTQEWNHLTILRSFLVLAATDTTSSSMTQIVDLLAQHPDVQERLREEIIQARDECNGDISYDKLVSLPYLDAVCRETLRL